MDDAHGPSLVPSASAAWLSVPDARCPDFFADQADKSARLGAAIIDPEMPLHPLKFQGMLQTHNRGERRRSAKVKVIDCITDVTDTSPQEPVTLRQLIQHHDQQNSSVVEDRPLEGKIRYRDDEHCKSFCKTVSDPRLFSMQAEMAQALFRTVRGVKMGLVPKSDVLLACMVRKDGSPPRTFFSALAAACGRNGRHQAKCLLVRCCLTHGSAPSDSSGFKGLRLQLAYHPHTPACHINLHGQARKAVAGTLQHMNMDEWSAEVLSCFAQFSTVTVFKLAHRPVDGDRYEVLDVYEGWTPRVVSFTPVRAHLEPLPGSPSLPPPAADSDDSEADLVTGCVHGPRQPQPQEGGDGDNDDIDVDDADGAHNDDDAASFNLERELERMIDEADALGDFADLKEDLEPDPHSSGVGDDWGAGDSESEEGGEGGHGEISLDVLRDNAVALVDTLDLETAKATLSLSTGPGWKYFADSDPRPDGVKPPPVYLGRFHCFGKVLSCTCYHGKGCKIMHNFGTMERRLKLEAHLVKWLAQGARVNSSADHAACIDGIKAQLAKI